MIVNTVPEITPDSLQTFYSPLLEQAAEFSRPPVSHYKACAVVIGTSGKAYLGSNFEVKRGVYADSIHAEQFAFTLAKLAGETGVKALVVSAEPCGHCRQFMMEAGFRQLPIYFQDSPNKPDAAIQWKQTTLETLLPSPFTLAGEGVNMYTHQSSPKQRIGKASLTARKQKLVDKALKAAAKSYHPITKNTWAGLALEMRNGQIVAGFPVESAAFNPTMTPLQVALVDMISQGLEPRDITRAVLIEPAQPDFSFKEVTQSTLKKLAPQVRLLCIKGRSLSS